MLGGAKFIHLPRSVFPTPEARNEVYEYIGGCDGIATKYHKMDGWSGNIFQEGFTSDLVIPSEWVDVSWHNDACPSYVMPPEGEGLHIFIDHQDPNEREPQGESMPRFFISRINDEGLGVGVWAGDDWEKAKSVMRGGPENAPNMDTTKEED